jgi:hypothetical protein
VQDIQITGPGPAVAGYKNVHNTNIVPATRNGKTINTFRQALVFGHTAKAFENLLYQVAVRYKPNDQVFYSCPERILHRNTVIGNETGKWCADQMSRLATLSAFS